MPYKRENITYNTQKKEKQTVTKTIFQGTKLNIKSNMYDKARIVYEHGGNVLILYNQTKLKTSVKLKQASLSGR